MKDKILKVILAFSITTNIGGYLHFKNTIEHKTNEISQLQDNVETKSTEIAKLDDAIKFKNEKIMKQQRVIDKYSVRIENYSDRVSKLDAKVKKLKFERDKALAENFKKIQKGSDVGVRQLTVEATAYTAMCREGCTGRTATGVDVSRTIYYKGYRVIAVDTRLIKLNSLVKVETKNETFTAIAIDTGGAIKGRIIDVLVSNESVARNFGRQQAKLTILKEGK